jgi:hypothetical protein
LLPAGVLDGLAALGGEALERPPVVALGVALFADADPRRRAGLRVEQHHVRNRDRRRHLDEARRLLGASRTAVLLHEVDALDRHAPGLQVHADDLAFLALVVPAHHADSVAAGDVRADALGIPLVTGDVLGAAGLAMSQNTHAYNTSGASDTIFM